MNILEGRRETKGGGGRRRCGGEEAYTPLPSTPQICKLRLCASKHLEFAFELYILRSFEISFVW